MDERNLRRVVVIICIVGGLALGELAFDVSLASGFAAVMFGVLLHGGELLTSTPPGQKRNTGYTFANMQKPLLITFGTTFLAYSVGYLVRTYL